MRLALCFAFAVSIVVAAAGCGPKDGKTSSGTSMALSGTVGAADLKKADRLFAKGLKLYRKGRPGKPDSNKHLQAASKCFRVARKIYQQAAREKPANKRLPRRIRDCNLKIYSCSKMQTL